MQASAIQDQEILKGDPTIVWFKLKKEKSLATTMAAFQQHPEVIHVEPNFRFRPTVYEIRFPQDPFSSSQWSLFDSRFAHIDLLRAWEITRGETPLLVAVIDTGVDSLHEDLQGRLFRNVGEMGDGKETNDFDDDSNFYIDDWRGWNFSSNLTPNNPQDDHGHGSHVSGLIAANSNNGIGISGIHDRALILSLKAFDRLVGGGTNSIIDAIYYAIHMGARIINASFGGGGNSLLLLNTIRAARDRDVLFVAAAGNEAIDTDLSPHFPSSYPLDNIISVAATDKEGKLAPFSNFGLMSVDIGAPGTEILSTVTTTSGYPGTVFDPPYLLASGTSMAVPHVVGVAALVRSKEPHLTYREVKERILRTGIPSPELEGKTLYGRRLNAYNAVRGEIPPSQYPFPEEWVSIDHRIETPHPYPHQIDQTWTIYHPGARMLRIHFQKIDTEDDFDFVQILDAERREIIKISGDFINMHRDYWSRLILGDTTYVRFKSNKSVNRYGFTIDKYSYVK